EKAAEHGISEAKYNLFLMYQKGEYHDFQKSLVWLQDVVKEGDESAIILFAQAMHDITDATKLDKYVKKGLHYLENKEFERQKGASEFIKAQIYGDESLSVFSEEKRNFHLKKSSDLGFERAKTLWEEYQRLADKN
ncbi:hypothetical protein OAP14_08780, partial [Aliiglaciecola sp.]|nr:hypothetical protein [Aliiglaciecola sp.]